MKHIPLIPLAGGLAMGVDNVLGNFPETVLSYDAFEFNDQHYINHLKRRDQEPSYDFIDFDTNNLDSPNFKGTNIVTALPPCAGLSMLNSSTADTGKSRGADAEQNQWMYKSTEFALSNIKPDVLMGENAPNLYTGAGLGVQKELYKIARKYDYTVQFIKTNNYFHGVPQNRMRTMYFFWKQKDRVPVYQWSDNDDETINLAEFLSQVPEDSLYHDVDKATELYNADSYLKYLRHKLGDDLREKIKQSSKGNALHFIEINDLMLEAADWLILNGDNETDERVGEKIKRKHKKVLDGKGYWNKSPKFFVEATNAIISKNRQSLVHPEEDRFLTLREQMHLMKLPHDYELIDPENGSNVICQNVIVDTAEHFARFAVDAINGNTDFINTTILKQHNLSKAFDDTSEIALKEPELF